MEKFKCLEPHFQVPVASTNGFVPNQALTVQLMLQQLLQHELTLTVGYDNIYYQQRLQLLPLPYY
jgi:hypothetical protein